MTDEEQIKALRKQERYDFKLIRRAAETLAELDRKYGLDDHQADVLAALRIRVEGKPREKLEDLLSAAGDIKGKKDLTDVIGAPEEKKSDWPEVEEQKRDWPDL
jgi:hypothetical protein